MTRHRHTAIAHSGQVALCRCGAWIWHSTRRPLRCPEIEALDDQAHEQLEALERILWPARSLS